MEHGEPSGYTGCPVVCLIWDVFVLALSWGRRKPLGLNRMLCKGELCQT